MKAREKQHRKRMAQSKEVFDRSVKRKMQEPLVVDEIGKPKLILLTPSEMADLRIDERYQRVKITAEVNELIHVIKSGGAIPDPLTLVERANGKQYIVDGQQRFHAMHECGIGGHAVIYHIDDFERERRLFLAMNKRKNLKSDYIVKAWPGDGAVLIRKLATTVDSPFYGNVSFGSKTKTQYSSTVLIKGIISCLLPDQISAGGRNISDTLARLDFEIKRQPAAIEKAESYLKLLALIFPPKEGKLTYLAAIALGRQAGIHWKKEIPFPGPKIYGRLRKIRWNEIPTPSLVFLPVLENQISTHWPMEKEG